MLCLDCGGAARFLAFSRRPYSRQQIQITKNDLTVIFNVFGDIRRCFVLQECKVIIYCLFVYVFIVYLHFFKAQI